jgi:hypothetical protein
MQQAVDHSMGNQTLEECNGNVTPAMTDGRRIGLGLLFST